MFVARTDGLFVGGGRALTARDRAFTGPGTGRPAEAVPGRGDLVPASGQLPTLARLSAGQHDAHSQGEGEPGAQDALGDGTGHGG